ncbi:serine kinase of HPr protein (carbohydrate metabolism regulator) [Rhizobium skierniewicense]|uniref:Serine kinase of HPr protein (Carbohydrate metabolism regulator) n=1 Tax=Rhizobium skierniewicense TaxID=984260 RepID=A0A7W6C9Q6_9HYPH|nr:HPr kinase/phosphorylase [Rhizobium skierniewicense]MBB3946543.1 serine kinase of HPr protein (carbohydrate metabolism regulator) [Rhizobium skierniewicense]
MSVDPPNLHATAIVIGKTGLLFVGPSGSGKSEMAFSFITEAQRCGLEAALVADDQVLMTCSGGTVIANRPAAIAGLLELRGSGIISLKSVASAEMHCAITSMPSPESPRLPPENERLELGASASLPLVRIPRDSITPYGKFAALAQNLFITKGM